MRHHHHPRNLRSVQHHYWAHTERKEPSSVLFFAFLPSQSTLRVWWCQHHALSPCVFFLPLAFLEQTKVTQKPFLGVQSNQNRNQIMNLPMIANDSEIRKYLPYASVTFPQSNSSGMLIFLGFGSGLRILLNLCLWGWILKPWLNSDP